MDGIDILVSFFKNHSRKPLKTNLPYFFKEPIAVKKDLIVIHKFLIEIKDR